MTEAELLLIQMTEPEFTGIIWDRTVKTKTMTYWYRFQMWNYSKFKSADITSFIGTGSRFLLVSSGEFFETTVTDNFGDCLRIMCEKPIIPRDAVENTLVVSGWFRRKP